MKKDHKILTRPHNLKGIFDLVTLHARYRAYLLSIPRITEKNTSFIYG